MKIKKSTIKKMIAEEIKSLVEITDGEKDAADEFLAQARSMSPEDAEKQKKDNTDRRRAQSLEEIKQKSLLTRDEMKEFVFKTPDGSNEDFIKQAYDKWLARMPKATLAYYQLADGGYALPAWGSNNGNVSLVDGNGDVFVSYADVREKRYAGEKNQEALYGALLKTLAAKGYDESNAELPAPPSSENTRKITGTDYKGGTNQPAPHVENPGLTEMIKKELRKQLLAEAHDEGDPSVTRPGEEDYTGHEGDDSKTHPGKDYESLPSHLKRAVDTFKKDLDMVSMETGADPDNRDDPHVSLMNDFLANLNIERADKEVIYQELAEYYHEVLVPRAQREMPRAPVEDPFKDIAEGFKRFRK